MYVSYYYVIGHSGSLMHRPRPSTVQTGNRWVDTQWTRSRQRADRERAMGELALNEQQTYGESITSIQPTTDWRRSRYEKCRSSSDDSMQRTISFTTTTFVCSLNPIRQTSLPRPYTIISLLSFHHCSSQPFQYLSVSSRAYTRLLNVSIYRNKDFHPKVH